MLIANPMYDTIFKHLMEDLNIAKGFLSQVLGKKIHQLTFYDREQSRYIPESESTKERIRLFHLDFVAEIDTPEGRGKVLIELQKNSEYDAAHRFRAYIGRAYALEKEQHEGMLKEEHRKAKEEQRKPRPVPPPEILPILPVVILGFKLDQGAPSSDDRMICHIKRSAVNPNAGNAPLDVRYQLAECLSHDLILIQVPYIPEDPKTDLELILSIFEQRFQSKTDSWKKEYPHHLPKGHHLEPLLRDILQKLHLITEDAEVAERIQGEEEGELLYQNLIASMEEKDRALQKKDRALEEKDRVLEEKDRVLEEKDRVLEEKNQALGAKDQVIQRALDHLISQGMSEAQARAALGISSE